MKMAYPTEFTKSILIFLQNNVEHHQRQKKTYQDFSLF